MKRYEPKTPRTALGLAAIALTALTLGLLVVTPTTLDAGSPDALTLARATAPPIEVVISPARIDVVGQRNRAVAAAEDAAVPSQAKPAS